MLNAIKDAVCVKVGVGNEDLLVGFVYRPLNTL